MWLINVKTKHLGAFHGSKIPPYAILSHTWGDDEVDFKAFRKGRAKHMKGYKKIEKACEIAAGDGIEYLWADTACISKDSSAELSESLNSMFQWYKRAVVCYAFLEDLPSDFKWQDKLPKCRWFTRGWTLQELIAPSYMRFYDKKWVKIGTRHSLALRLSQITNIDLALMQGKAQLSRFCVAQKMSWAANRETTRIEDRAYCLLGIFDVHMPLLYGEEERAFLRLQEEIIRRTPDFSIFAWTQTRIFDPFLLPGRSYCGLLATSPNDFDNFQSLGLKEDTECDSFDMGDFSLSNGRLRSRVPILSRVTSGKRQSCILPLNISPMFPDNDDCLIGVKLRKCGADVFVRDDPRELYIGPRAVTQKGAPRERYYFAAMNAMHQSTPGWVSEDFITGRRPFALQIHLQRIIQTQNAWPWSRFDAEDKTFFSSESMHDSCMLKMSVRFGPRKNRYLEFVFYATGWSSTNLDSLQCSIIEYNRFKRKIDEVQTQNENWDDNRNVVLAGLAYCGIPKCSSLAYHVPHERYGVHLTYKLESLIGTPDYAAHHSFWKVTFQAKNFDDKDQMPVSTRTHWRVPSLKQ